MKPTKKMPLFIISGASGIGKSTACEILFQNECDYIVMESDLLWHEMYNTPHNSYYEYRQLWLRVCANISQIGKPVVLCVCALPEQFELCSEYNLFTKVYYLAIVCDDQDLENRMRIGREIIDENWIKNSRDFNQWLKKNADKYSPPIKLLDTSKITPNEAANTIHKWIKKI